MLQIQLVRDSPTLVSPAVSRVAFQPVYQHVIQWVQVVLQELLVPRSQAHYQPHRVGFVLLNFNLHIVDHILPPSVHARPVLLLK